MAFTAGIAKNGVGVDLAAALLEANAKKANFLAIIGGLAGIAKANGRDFRTSVYDLGDAENPGYVEGSDAPDAEHIARVGEAQVCEAFRQTLAVSDVEEALSLNSGVSDVASELAFQLKGHLKALANKINKSSVAGTYADGSLTPFKRKMRGIVNAITTNVVDAESAALTKALLSKLAKAGYDANADGMFAMVCDSDMKTKIDALYEDNTKGSMTVAGVVLDTVNISPLKNVAIIIDNDVAAGTILLVDVDVCRLRGIRLDQFGGVYVYVKPLGSKGDYTAALIEADLGLDYGTETKHAKMVNIATA
ncbi:MAG: DUF5309 family protein [Pseudodesulfovibrio sp.]|uniref:SU10 major capsid protein n=1 Tax=Pseudodesulfovibrio sp. TaxID=2035812 RepID=UPI003D12E99C